MLTLTNMREGPAKRDTFAITASVLEGGNRPPQTVMIKLAVFCKKINAISMQILKFV